MSKNWFGNASDGNLIIAANTQLTVPNKNGSYDGDMVIKQYGSLVIEEGFTLTTDQPGRGLLIYVLGDCTINGTLSMTARGPQANPTAAGGSDSGVVPAGGLQYPVFTPGGSDSLSAGDFSGCGTGAVNLISNQPGIAGNGDVITFERQGAAGGAGGSGSGGTNYPGHTPRQPGSNGTTGQTGGGGGADGQSGVGGSGSYGSCWGGGSGGGGAVSASWPSDGVIWGGSGGNATHQGGNAGGGAGNPGGSGSNGGSSGGAGTGGMVMLVVGGDLVIGSNGAVRADGVNGGDGESAGGAASGGGNIALLQAGTFINNGTISAAGGIGGTSTAYGCSGLYGCCGGPGGSGSAQQMQINPGWQLSGALNTQSQVLVIDEDTWEVQTYKEYLMGTYGRPTTSGNKTIFAVRPDGEVVGYGNVSPK